MPTDINRRNLTLIFVLLQGEEFFTVFTSRRVAGDPFLYMTWTFVNMLSLQLVLLTCTTAAKPIAPVIETRSDFAGCTLLEHLEPAEVLANSKSLATNMYANKHGHI